MSYGTIYQRDKKNHYRPKAGEVGFKTSAGLGKGKNVWKVCIICKEKKRVEVLGRHQRQWICLNCQPKLQLEV